MNSEPRCEPGPERSLFYQLSNRRDRGSTTRWDGSERREWCVSRDAPLSILRSKGTADRRGPAEDSGRSRSADAAEQAVLLALDARGEVEDVLRPTAAAVAEHQSPEAIDPDRITFR